MALPPSDSAVAYLSPTYLRTPIREYLVPVDKGVYWFRAPRDGGKTQLARGVIERRPSAKDPATMEGIDSNLASDVRAIGFYIARSDNEGPRQLIDGLAGCLADSFGLSEAEKAPLLPVIRFEDAAAACADFVAWLKTLQEAVVARGGRRLVVCIDGLDAIAEPGSGAFAESYSILDLLPSTAELPSGVILLVTSRPAAECPAGLYERIAAKFANSPGFAQREIDLDDKEYVELLNKYFKEKLRPWFRTRCIKHWTQMLDSRAKFEKGGRDQRLTDDPGFRDALKDDWKKLCNKFPRYSGIPLPVTTVAGILDENDKLWADMMEKTEKRFRLVALMIDRLATGALKLDEVPALPKGDELAARLGA